MKRKDIYIISIEQTLLLYFILIGSTTILLNKMKKR